MRALKTQWEVKHSASKTAWNVIGTQLGGKYKIARVPYIQLDGDDETSQAANKFQKKEALEHATLIAAAPQMLASLRYLGLSYHDENNHIKETITKSINQATTL